jgi:hypothetical protein
MATETLVNGALQALLCGIALSTSTSAVAATEHDDTVPDAEFLEYLGMWETSDEDWLLLEGQDVAEPDPRSDPAPTGEESTEANDEA